MTHDASAIPALSGVEGSLSKGRRITTATKLWIAGLGLPTLLLLLATGFFWWVGPQVGLIEKLAESVDDVPQGWVTIRLDPPFGKGDESDGSVWWHRYLGRVVMITTYGPVLTPEDLRVIGKMRHVTHLVIGVSPGTSEADLEPLTQLESLSSIKIFDSLPITDRGSKILSRIRTLQSIEIFDARVTAEGLHSFAALEHLAILDLGDAKITAESVTALQQLKRLTRVHLHDCEISDDAVEPLVSLPISKLTLNDIRVSPAAFQKLGSINSLYDISFLSPGLLPPDAFTGFPGTSRLIYLVIVDEPRVDDPMLSRIAGIKSLENLNLEGCPTLTDAGLLHLYNHPSLQDVLLPKQISDTALEELRKRLPSTTSIYRTSDTP